MNKYHLKKDYAKQDYLEKWQLDHWIEKHRAFLYFALIVAVGCFILSGFGNPIP